MIPRAQVVAAARGWIGTPYHHLGRVKGVGVDCAGLLIGIARELGIVEQDFDVPTYPRRPDGRTLLELCGVRMRRIDRAAMRAGDVVVLAAVGDPRHIGILADYTHGGLSMIHACGETSCVPPRVIETRLMLAGAMRFAAAFAIPGVE